eukprot:COSAG01_NODE_9986_length_2283_cov_1.360348_3_plen_80_part_01
MCQLSSPVVVQLPEVPLSSNTTEVSSPNFLFCNHIGTQRLLCHSDLGAIASDVVWYMSVDLPGRQLMFSPAAPTSWQSVA